MSNLPEMVMLTRSMPSRAAQNMITRMIAWRLWQICLKEKPYMTECFQDKKGTDVWNVEKQFWLKNKKAFHRMGFLPPTVNDMKQEF